MGCPWFSSGRARKKAKDAASPAPTAPAPATVVRRLIRVSDERDGTLINRGYSYWPQAWVNGRNVFVFCGAEDGVPRLFDVGLAGDGYNDSVSRVPWILPYRGTTEGWYWGKDGWLYLIDGPRLRKVKPLTGEDVVVFECEPGYVLWQAHSSDGGHVHSATVRDAVTYATVGWTVHRDDGGGSTYPVHGDPDECQITADGALLVIKETLEDGLSNRVINIRTGAERVIRKADGAVGHSDCGSSSMVGEWSPPPGPDYGQCVEWNLDTFQRRELFPTWNLGHVAVRGDTALISGAVALSLYQRFAEGGGTLTHLVDHGMVGEGYDFQVMGNISPDGSVAAFMSNKEGRMDAYLVTLR